MGYQATGKEINSFAACKHACCKDMGVCCGCCTRDKIAVDLPNHYEETLTLENLPKAGRQPFLISDDRASPRASVAMILFTSLFLWYATYSFIYWLWNAVK